MNSSLSIMSVSELTKILIEINNCDNTKVDNFLDGTKAEYKCCIESMCNSCIDKMAGLLEWAEDSGASDAMENTPLS